MYGGNVPELAVKRLGFIVVSSHRRFDRSACELPSHDSAMKTSRRDEPALGAPERILA
jgi:hypothetical protein